MTQDQFDALAELLRLRGGAAKEAARMVLIDGLSPADAARATGISPQSVTNAVTRCRKGLALSKAVFSRGNVSLFDLAADDCGR